MHFSTKLLSIATLVSIAAAQTTPAVPTVPVAAAPTGAVTGVCEGENVLTACLSSTTAIAQACQSTDYSCLCNAWDAVLTYVTSFFSFLLSPISPFSPSPPRSPSPFPKKKKMQTNTPQMLQRMSQRRRRNRRPLK